ncbi:MAG: ATP phosphoribosyltransferase regulatory subunit, partial [Alphaproteobacteria bacterium]
ALFEALLDSLSLPDVWRRRLARAFGDNALVEAQLDEMSGKTSRPRPAHASLPPELELGDRDAAREAVEELLDSAGIPQVGGRSAAEIADRFVEQATLGAGSESDIAAAEVVRRFLAISGPPDEAAMVLGELAAERAPGLAIAVARFTQRIGGLVGHGIDVDRLDFSADFGRRLDYYTGFVFELSASAEGDAKPLAGGGRYDRLLSLIRKRDGSVVDVPAVGFALWLDRLEAAAP